MINFLSIYATQILTTHIFAGGISLLLATINAIYILIANPRHDRFLVRARITHRVIWSMFHISMAIIGLTGVALSFITIPVNYFLFSVALFTLYMVTAASRAFLGRTLRRLDTILGGVMIVVGAAMIIYGLSVLIVGTRSFTVAPLVVFGGIGCAFGVFDLRFIRRARSASAFNQDEFNNRFFSRNFGALIATLTAFLVVNVESHILFLTMLAWVGPAALLSPMIGYFTRLHRDNKTERSGIAGRLQQHIRSGFAVSKSKANTN